MSEYTLPAESSATSVAAANLFPVFQSGVLKQCAASDILAYIGSATNSGGTYNGATINSAMLNGTFSVSSSLVVGATLSAKIGFWGAAGTSAATTIAALTTTLTTASNGVGFSTSANCFSVISAVNTLISTLKDCGIVKT